MLQKKKAYSFNEMSYDYPIIKSHNTIRENNDYKIMGRYIWQLKNCL